VLRPRGCSTTNLCYLVVLIKSLPVVGVTMIGVVHDGQS
jgi:hypothetical protein